MRDELADSRRVFVHYLNNMIWFCYLILHKYRAIIVRYVLLGTARTKDKFNHNDQVLEVCI